MFLKIGELFQDVFVWFVECPLDPVELLAIFTYTFVRPRLCVQNVPILCELPGRLLANRSLLKLLSGSPKDLQRTAGNLDTFGMPRQETSIDKCPSQIANLDLHSASLPIDAYDTVTNSAQVSYGSWSFPTGLILVHGISVKLHKVTHLEVQLFSGQS